MIIAKVVTLQADCRAEQEEQEEVEDLGWNIGDEFEVDNISVSGWHTDVTLKGGDFFNSCFFEFYEDGKPLNVYSDGRFQKHKFIK